MDTRSLWLKASGGSQKERLGFVDRFTVTSVCSDRFGNLPS
jgi:hypothetical protein